MMKEPPMGLETCEAAAKEIISSALADLAAADGVDAWLQWYVHICEPAERTSRKEMILIKLLYGALKERGRALGMSWDDDKDDGLDLSILSTEKMLKKGSRA